MFCLYSTFESHIICVVLDRVWTEFLFKLYKAKFESITSLGIMCRRSGLILAVECYPSNVGCTLNVAEICTATALSASVTKQDVTAFTVTQQLF